MLAKKFGFKIKTKKNNLSTKQFVPDPIFNPSSINVIPTPTPTYLPSKKYIPMNSGLEEKRDSKVILLSILKAY
jgi:hypothetical protein